MGKLWFLWKFDDFKTAISCYGRITENWNKLHIFASVKCLRQYIGTYEIQNKSFSVHSIHMRFTFSSHQYIIMLRSINAFTSNVIKWNITSISMCFGLKLIHALKRNWKFNVALEMLKDKRKRHIHHRIQ